MFNHVKSVGCIFSLLSLLSNFWSCRQVDFRGRCLLDFNSWALKVQRVASLKCSVCVRRVQLAQFEVKASGFRFSHIATQSKSNQFYELIQFFSLWFWCAKVSRVKLLVS